MNNILLTEEIIRQQQKDATLHRFENSDAWRLGCLARELAGDNAENVCISISRGDHLLFYSAGANTMPENADWVQWKTNTVKRFTQPSYSLKLQFNGDADLFLKDRRLDPEKYVFFGGGFPIRVENAGFIGVLAVSGLPDEEDHMLCYNALCAFKKEQESNE